MDTNRHLHKKGMNEKMYPYWYKLIIGHISEGGLICIGQYTNNEMNSELYNNKN